MIGYSNLGDPKWDKGLVLDLLAGRLASGGHRFSPQEQANVVLAPVGTADTDIKTVALQAALADDWAVVLATSDECSTWKWWELQHPSMNLWIQTPRPRRHAGLERFLVHGTPPGTAEYMAAQPRHDKDVDWFFAGQVNHDRRKQMVAALRETTKFDGLLLESGGFAQGLPRNEYLGYLLGSKIALAPSGPCTPDSFRLWESLEAGCVPLVDARCPAYDPGYWPLVLGDDHPLYLVEDWGNVADIIRHQLSIWPANATRCSAWWQQYKRNLHWRINDDVSEVSGVKAPTEPVTVLIPTSPIPSHPSTEMIEETVASVRYWHPTAELMILADGVRPEQESRRADYEAYLNRVMWLCEHRWGNTHPIVFADHQHQANMTRAALKKVRTPLILFVEHDTPLVTDEPIDWAGIFDVVEAGRVDVMRFHFETIIQREAKRLMRDTEPVRDTVGYLRTVQWSQRPHVASADYYRRIIEEQFPPSGRTMIEDKMHSICQVQPWGRNRVAIYAPPGESLKRSLNLDGRGDDVKYEMKYA